MSANRISFFVFLCAVLMVFSTNSTCAGEMESYDTVKIRALDKVTARAETLDLKIGETTQFGSVFIKAQACKKALPIEQPESAAFIQVWDFPANRGVIDQENPEWVYSGWMFASSPGLAAMDHPIYDIWVLDCLGDVIAETEDDLEADDQNIESEAE